MQYLPPFPIVPWMQIAPSYQKGTILLGNGASIAVSPNFNYSSLLCQAMAAGLLTNDVHQLFNSFGTQDFELILRQLRQAFNVNKALGIPDQITHQAYQNVRDCLIRSVRDTHPTYEQTKNQLPNMHQFLKGFDTVISLNYDLLVYWTMLYGNTVDDSHKFKDCFLSGTFQNDWQQFRNLRDEQSNTLVFYPHGNLALCRDAWEQEAKIQSAEANLLETILQKWHSEEVSPLFISEGTMQQKISSIQSSYYLSKVYWEVLTSQRSTLTLFGWGLGDQDRHLLQRMQGSGIQRVAVSVFRNDQTYCHHAYQVIQTALGPVSIDFFDSESPGCWIHP